MKNKKRKSYKGLRASIIKAVKLTQNGDMEQLRAIKIKAAKNRRYRKVLQSILGRPLKSKDRTKYSRISYDSFYGRRPYK